MADQVTENGLQKMGENNSGIGTVDPIDAMGWSDFGTILSTTSDITSATNEQINALDSTPTRSAQEITYISTLTTAQLNGVTISTITLHHDGAGVGTGVGAGVDGLSIQKASSFSLTTTMKIDHTNQT